MLDQLAERIAVLAQPVCIDQSWSVVVGCPDDLLHERLHLARDHAPRLLQLERCHVLRQVGLLIFGQREAEHAIVVLHDIGERRRAAIVKVRRML